MYLSLSVGDFFFWPTNKFPEPVTNNDGRIVLDVIFEGDICDSSETLMVEQ